MMIFGFVVERIQSEVWHCDRAVWSLTDIVVNYEVRAQWKTRQIFVVRRLGATLILWFSQFRAVDLNQQYAVLVLFEFEDFGSSFLNFEVL